MITTIIINTGIKRSKLAILGILLTTLVGCGTTSTVTISRNFQNTPEITRNNMSDTLQCMARALQGTSVNQAFVFMIRDLTDGTVSNDNYANGPLSDAGRIQMVHALSNNTYPYLGLVTDNFPRVFRPTANETIGLNRLGIPSNANFNAMNAVYGQLIRNARRSKNMSQNVQITPLIVSGSFTRYDTENLYQDGSGHDMGSRSRDTSRRSSRGSGNIDFGTTDSVKAITLVVNLIDPKYNLIIKSQSFDLLFHQRNKTFRLRFAIGDGFYGYSKNNVVVEGVHGAQQALIDAASAWVLNTAYGQQLSMNHCYTEDTGYLAEASHQQPLEIPHPFGYYANLPAAATTRGSAG